MLYNSFASSDDLLRVRRYLEKGSADDTRQRNKFQGVFHVT